MTRYRMNLEGHAAFETTVVHEVQVDFAVQQQCIESALSGAEPEPVQLLTSNKTKESDTLRAVDHSAILVT